MLLLAAGDHSLTLSHVEQSLFHRHVADCGGCRALAIEADENQSRCLSRIADDAFDDSGALVMPMVDPIVFHRGDELARGGMGRITRARDRRLGRDVAIKEVLAPVLRARFEREAMITARLQHPAIVPIYEAGTWPDGSAFYTMRLVSGGTLAEAIDKQPTLDGRLALLPHVIALTEALAYAHSQRIVHRDLKPGNVLVGEFGETVVIDWGLAKQLGGGPDPVDAGMAAPSDSALTRAGAVIGTPCFIAPEQAAGEEIDERADVYALGAILYNVLAGRPPHWDSSDRTADHLVDAALELPPEPIARVAPRAPSDLRAIVECAMARDRGARYPTAKAMAEELRRFAAGQLLASRRYPLYALLARWLLRHRTVVAVAAVAMVIVAAVGAGAVVNIARSSERARNERDTAEHARRVADVAVAAGFEELGRNELLAGDHEGALAYLAAAYRGGRDGVAMRQLLAAATRDLDLHDYSIDAGDTILSTLGYLDDGRVVTVNWMDQGTIAIWDGTKRVAAYPITEVVYDARLSPDARRLAVNLDHEKLAVYDTVTGKRRWQTVDHDVDYLKLVFDRSGSSLVVFGAPFLGRGGAQLRDAETGAVRAKLVAGGGRPVAAAFSPDDSLVATCGDDGAVGVWNTRTGTLLKTSRHGGALAALAFVDNTRLAIVSADGDAWIWQLTGSATVPLGGHLGEVTAIAARKDAIAIGGKDGTVRLWNAEGKLLGEARDVRGKIAELVFSPDGAMLAGDGEDKRVYIWDTRALALRRAITAFTRGSDRLASSQGFFHAAEHGLAWSPKGARLSTLGFGEPQVSVWRAPDGDRVDTFDSEASSVVGGLVVTATNTALTSRPLTTGRPVRRLLDVALSIATPGDSMYPDTVQSGGEGRVLVWDFDRANVIDVMTGAKLAEVSAAAANSGSTWTLSPDGRLVAQHVDDKVRVFDATTGRLVRELAPVGRLWTPAFAPDSDRLVIPSGEDGLQQLRVSTGESTEFSAIAKSVRGLRLDPAGHRLAVFFYSGRSALVTDADTGDTIATIRSAGSGQIEDARFDAAGHRVIVRAEDRSVTVWDVDKRASLFAVEDVPRQAFAITADGGRLATGGDDGMIQIRDCASGRLLAQIHGDGPVATLAWSSDGTRLLAQSTNERASIWDVHLEQRSVAEIDALAQRTGWKVVEGLLVRAQP